VITEISYSGGKGTYFSWKAKVIGGI